MGTNKINKKIDFKYEEHHRVIAKYSSILTHIYVNTNKSLLIGSNL